MSHQINNGPIVMCDSNCDICHPKLNSHKDCNEKIASLEKRCEELEKCLKDAIPLDEMDAAKFRINEAERVITILNKERFALEKENALLRKVKEAACELDKGISRTGSYGPGERLQEALSASERGEK